jgi:hypothetical protein
MRENGQSRVRDVDKYRKKSVTYRTKLSNAVRRQQSTDPLNAASRAGKTRLLCLLNAGVAVGSVRSIELVATADPVDAVVGFDEIEEGEVKLWTTATTEKGQRRQQEWVVKEEK